MNTCRYTLKSLALNILILAALLFAILLGWWAGYGARAGTISFISSRDGNWEIYTVRANGRDLRRLTYQPSDDFDVSWSPDGRLAFVSVPNSGGLTHPYEVHVMNGDGSNQKTLAGNREQNWRPAWSPDGQWIAYISYRPFEERTGFQFDIYLIRPDGREEHPLLHTRENERDLAWSPNGKWIAFAGGHTEMFRSFVPMAAI